MGGKRENAGFQHLYGVRGREVECQPCNHEVPSLSPGSRSQLREFFNGPHIWREYWCTSQEAESREISIRFKNLFLNRYKINTFKLTFFAFSSKSSKAFFFKVVKRGDCVLTLAQTSPGFYASAIHVLKTLWEMEKLLVTSNSSFSHSVF